MSHLRLLFWLKWKLMWRGYRRDKSAVLGVILAVVIFLPMALGVALGCAVGFIALRQVNNPHLLGGVPYNEHLLRAVLLGIYLFWLFAPLMGYALNESYDVTKLFVYPLSVRQIFTGAIFGSLMDFPVLFLLPTLIAVIIGFTTNVFTFVLVFIPVALFLFHTLSLSQAIILASAGILRSRRFRDVVIIIIPLFWMGYYLLTQMMSRQMVKVDWSRIGPRFLDGITWEVINLLPSGCAARAIGAAQRGEYVLTFVFLTGLTAFTVGTIYLAGWLVEKVYAGEVISPTMRKRKARDKERETVPSSLIPHPSSRAPLGVRLPPVIEAVMDKELKYIFRDPYFKVRLVNLVYMLIVVVFAFVLRSGHSDSWGSFTPGMLWGVTGWMLLSEMQFLFNLFGTEGGAASVLFMFPSSRRQILMGKNLMLFVALSVVNLAFITILAAVSGAWHLFGPLLCWMELTLIVFIALGNLVSVYFPYRVVMRGWRVQQQSASRGCGYSFIYMGVTLLAFVFLLPLLAALLVPTIWVSPAWLALTIPFAVAYAFSLYALSLHLAEPLLMRREVAIMEKVGQEE